MVPEAFGVVDHSGAIAATGAYQTVLPANAQREGGVIQNTSAHVLYLGMTHAASAADAKSIQLAAGGTVTLNFGIANGVYQGEVCLKGTVADTFVAKEFTRS
jgi:hypothetical protein